MSYVTNALITSRYIDKKSHTELQSRHWSLVNGAAGGSKVWEADSYLKAFNHTLMVDIVAEAQSCLHQPDACLLVVHDESDNDDQMHVWFWSVTTREFVAVDPRPATPTEDQ